MASIKSTGGALHLLQPRQILEAGDGDLNDGGGLWLRVSQRGASWVWRYTAANGKRRELGLGAAARGSLRQAGETLVAARGQARAARDLLAKGLDPLEERRAQREQAQAAERAEALRRTGDDTGKVWTLARCARAYHERVIEPTRSPKHAAQWISSLENHIPASLWHAPIASIRPPQLLRALTEIKPHPRSRRHGGDVPHETVRRIRQRLEIVFDDAHFHERCDGNAAEALRRKLVEAMPRQSARGQFRALAYGKAPDLMRRLRQAPGQAARCLEFALLTAARSSEARLATWEEFDLDARTWTVPATRMKAKEKHIVFLSEQAMRVLRGQRGQDGTLVFPGHARADDGSLRPQSNMAMAATLKRLGAHSETTAHGLCRATFSTWANDTLAAHKDVIEACLAHRESDRVRAAYNRAEFLAQRKALLQAWADYLDGQGPQAQAVGAHRAPADPPATPVHGSGDPLACVPAVADLMGVS